MRRVPRRTPVEVPPDDDGAVGLVETQHGVHDPTLRFDAGDAFERRLGDLTVGHGERRLAGVTPPLAAERVARDVADDAREPRPGGPPRGRVTPQGDPGGLLRDILGQVLVVDQRWANRRMASPWATRSGTAPEEEESTYREIVRRPPPRVHGRAQDGRSRHRSSPAGHGPQGGVRPYTAWMAWQDRISMDPSIRSGKPCVRGTRITVYDVLEYLAGGMSEDQILADFPSLTREDIRACLAFAAARERRQSNSVA